MNLWSGRASAGCFMNRFHLPSFSSLVFMSLIGIFWAPIAHRTMHRFYMDDNGMEKKAARDE
jgi:hypothetical protein